MIVGLWTFFQLQLLTTGILLYGTSGPTDTGYGDLVEEIIAFFKTGKIPVPAEETIEIFAFMSAADESKSKGGMAVTLESVIEKAKNKMK